MLDQEPLLARPVSISRERVYLGELLEIISRETSVPLYADDRIAPISGYEIALRVHQAPAREVLANLAALYHAPPDRWYWTRGERAGRKALILRCTLSPRVVQEQRNAYVRDYILDQRRRLAAFAALPEARRAELARGDRFLTAANDPRSLGFISFYRDLPDDAVRSVLDGKRYDIPTASLGPEGRAFILNEHRLARLLNRSDVKPPDQVGRLSLYGESSSERPGIALKIGPVGAHGVLGGTWLWDDLKQNARRTWSGSGDRSDLPDEPVPAPGVPFQPQDVAIRGSKHADVVVRLGRLSGWNVLYDRGVRRSRGSSRERGLQGPLPAVVETVASMDLVWKRRDRFLLFREMDWQNVKGDTAVPWPMLKALRESAAGNGGYLRSGDWLALARLSPDQLSGLSDEFPDAGFLHNVLGVLRFVSELGERERAAVARDGGAGWADWSSASRSRLLAQFDPLGARRFRLLLRWEEEKHPHRLLLAAGTEEQPGRLLKFDFRPRVPEPAK